ncbi:transcriptional regulator, LysR family [Beutenbergia cavernae DSM 12333]|uniref:Transcriptional regulator, LysR family n=1 Tax=Beutenbergia cavernae (strain ATCC BAA-8 / DSM 12333 / CCUG 43141 / JCM 11478 / NBRC 16432 / NCIMB 13614 / HKI 0122) TaxID=471853 RepID=C5BYQ9_BEUC1|nr:LysR substrate-binding domain-containing protein [Beutenbergia cavernae]ACQ79017.1 transcriptional regulator, LysR family [Beutenbergia cavernae DSM 12333]
MELRDIEIFLTLADELHFGRTAERLHVSQARVSQAIKQQERRLGGALFERTSRRVSLTPLGEQLRDDLRVGYDAIKAGIARAGSVAGGVGGELRLGVMGNDAFQFFHVLDRFEADNPGCSVSLHETHFSDAFAALRREELDVLAVWRPVREPDLVEGPPVFRAGRVLVVWSGHELAAHEAVSLEDVADHVRIDPHAGPEYWIDAMLPRVTPSGRVIPRRGPRPTTFHEILGLVASRQCVTLAGAQAALYSAHPGVVFVPVADAPLLTWVLTWRAQAETPLVRALARAAREVGPLGPADLRTP